jgi:diguanylate cyclase (GGDEF)-like protein
MVCANDAMALGAMEELKARGYRVPEDIAVTGFDNDALSHYCKPSLTTADQNQEAIGSKAVEILLSQPAELQKEQVEPGAFFGESCGCAKAEEFDADHLRKVYTSEKVGMQQALDEIKNMSMDLAGLESFSEMYEKLKRYVAVSDMESFFLCIKAEETEQVQKIQIPLAMHHGGFCTYGELPAGDILPEEWIDTEEPGFYVVTPLYYGKTNFGYCVQQGSYFALESELAYTWVVNVGIAIENIRKYRLMQKMVDALNSMWMYDTLTNIYNRGGFYHSIEPMMQEWKKQNRQCYILFLDLDGLKKINDNLGHEYGDACIKSMAEILTKTLKMTEDSMGASFCMRYGGDEFVACGECKDADETEQLVHLLRENIKAENQKEKGYEVACSVGYSVYPAREIENLDHLFEEADKKMYQEKKIKHTRGD